MEQFEFSGYKPGALSEVVRLHMDYYAPHWGFGKTFETKVAAELAEFLAHFQPERDLFLVVYDSAIECVASISLSAQNSADNEAYLRWFIVDQNVAGEGIGRALINRVVEHCRNGGFSKVYLSARKLYESVGFVLVQEMADDRWKGGVTEQLFVWEVSR